MLTIPAHRYFNDYRVTAYQDDSMFWKFYLIPDYVEIRRDFNGNPVFLLIKYAFSDQDREENPDLGRGGGYLAFDCQMSVREADYAKIVEALQKDVNDQWNQMKAIADAHGQDVRGYRIRSFFQKDDTAISNSLSIADLSLGLNPEAPEAPPGDQPPKVIIANPTWTEGTFRVSAPQSEQLVSHRVTEGPVSLVGNNVVSANMDLTEAGATFMERTLVDIDGSGGTDLTPIQVLYELKFWARIPPVRLRITADSRSVYMALQQLYHDYEGRGCDEDAITHYETQMQMAVSKGLINVQLDTGTLDLSDDFIQEMRNSAMKFVQDQIKDKFFETKPAPPPEDFGDLSEEEKDLFILKTQFDMQSMSIEYNEVMQSIQEWSVNPQGTMQAFFADLSPQEMTKYVRVVDLDDDFYKTLGLTVTAFADWENEPLAFIEAQILYEGRDENGQDVEKVETFTFTKDNTTGTWDPSLIKNKREYSYRWRVGFEGREPGEFTRWERDTTPQLNLSVANPGKLAVDVLAGNINFQQTVEQVQVELSYADPASGVQEEETTMIFTDGVQSKAYARYLYTEMDHPYRYRSRFFLKGGQQVESAWQESVARQLLINEPFFDRLDVQLVPTGDWDGVVQTVVNLRYSDLTHDYHTDEAFSLKGIDEFKTWQVVLQDPNQRTFEYRVLTTFADGTSAQSDWIVADGDQALPIRVRQSPRLKVDLMPDLVDFSVTPIVQCTMRYGDGSNGHVQTFAFNKAEGQSWSLLLEDEQQPRSYRYQIAYHSAEGEAMQEPEVTTDQTALVIPKLNVPEITCMVVPKLVNFVATPVVEVNVEYEDFDHGIDFSDTLLFTEPESQQVRIQVDDASPRAYRLGITYYTAEGQVIEQETVTTDKNKIVIPPYVPVA